MNDREDILSFLKKRYRNYGFWISLASAILLVLTSFGLKIDNEQIMNIVRAVLGTLTIVGVINNPTTDSSGYGDDPKPLEESKDDSAQG
jgi:phi LC3 family holin